MEPVDALRVFWTAMYEWERRALRLTQAARPAILDVAPLVAERMAIIAEFCTPKRRVYSEPFSCGEPTQYDPANEEVLELVTESPRRVVVHTQQRAGFENCRRYVMRRKGDLWLLDSWQWLCDGKWDRGII